MKKNAPVPFGKDNTIKISNSFDSSKHKMVKVAKGVYVQASLDAKEEDVIENYYNKKK